jgi:2-amino-4-hydroxy-6-hydroxymethyldihydropteridine diphosphokinase
VAYIALGANIAGPYGEPAAAVAIAIARIRSLGAITAQSRLYRSTAWPDPRDPEFINAVIALETHLAPDVLLTELHIVETDFGRVRGRANAPRSLDLDIVDYDGRISGEGDTPILPHPRLAQRAFVLLPLADIAPNWRHPVTGAAIADLVAALPDPASADPASADPVSAMPV